jgi:hypothetical protein
MTRAALLLSVAFIVATLAAGAETITNDDVIRMARAGLSAETIELKIEHSEASFDISTDALIALKEAGVHEKTIRLMIERQKSASREGTGSSPQPLPQPAPEPATPEPPTARAKASSTHASKPSDAAPPTTAVQSPPPSAPTPSAAAPTAPRPLHEITIRNPTTGAQCGSGFLSVDAGGLAATGCLGSNFRLKWSQVESICSGPGEATRIRLTTKGGPREFSADTVESRDAIAALVTAFAPALTIQPCTNH